MKTIDNYIKGIDELALARAKRYLDGNKVKSVKFLRDPLDPDEFEAFVEESKNQVLLPEIEVDGQFRVQDIHCQCKNHEQLCIHKVALLLAAQIMIDTNCPDYHMALKLQTANALNRIFFPS